MTIALVPPQRATSEKQYRSAISKRDSHISMWLCLLHYAIARASMSSRLSRLFTPRLRLRGLEQFHMRGEGLIYELNRFFTPVVDKLHQFLLFFCNIVLFFHRDSQYVFSDNTPLVCVCFHWYKDLRHKKKLPTGHVSERELPLLKLSYI